MVVSPAVRFHDSQNQVSSSQRVVISVSSGSSQGASRLAETESTTLPLESSRSASKVTEQS